MSVKFVVRLKSHLARDSQFMSRPGRVAQTTWNSRQPTAQLAAEEGAAVLGVNTDQVDVVGWGEIDWSESGDIIEMDAQGNFK